MSDNLQRLRALADTELATERLVLEPLQPHHADDLLAGLQDPALYRYIPQEPPPDLAWLTARFKRIAARGPADGSAVWFNWAMRLINGQWCGQFEATAQAGIVDIAYFVFAPYQRQGLAREAAARVIAALWSDPDVTKIGASLDTRNAASAALVQSLGFSCVDTVTDADFFKGEPSHEYRYELSRQGTAK